MKPRLLISNPDHFLYKYIVAEFDDYTPSSFSEATTYATDADIAVVLPSDDVIIEIPKASSYVFINTRPTIEPAAQLLTAHIIGTAMDGIPMTMAKLINRGTYYNTSESEAHLSVVHAIDVAKAAKCLVGMQGTYYINDDTNPSFAQLAEALSWRLGHKRIPTLSEKTAKWANLLGWLIGGANKKLLTQLTTETILPPTSEYLKQVGIPTINVVRHLSTHQYSETDI